MSVLNNYPYIAEDAKCEFLGVGRGRHEMSSCAITDKNYTNTMA
jgi:hypothetical protein